MALTAITGQHFVACPTSVWLFKQYGGYTGSNWVMSQRCDHNYFVFETPPDPASPSVRAVIASDQAQGRDHLIAFILVSPDVAARLFLEGVLLFQHFSRATESIIPLWSLSHEPMRIIVVPDVVFDQRVFPFVVMDAAPGQVMTVDAQWQVV